MAVLFLLTVLLQTALIAWQHFSPFERESNLRAVLWGARPAPRYWAVVLLDVCTILLVALLVLGAWPQAPDDEPLARLARMLPAWAAAALLAAVFHHYINDTVVRFPFYVVIARRAVLGLILGAVVVMATLLVIVIAVTPDLGSAVGEWARILPAVLLPAYGLALLVFILRALAFFLRVIPVVGSFAHAAVSTGLLVWAMERYGRLVGEAIGGMVWPGLSGLEGVALGIGAAALVALLAAWRLPGSSRGADAADPPALVVDNANAGSPTSAKPSITITGATLASAHMQVEVTRLPFSVVVKNAQGEMLWQLAERGLTRDLLLCKILSIPILYTGNTIKLKRRALGRPVTPVTGIKAEGDALIVSLRDATLRLSFHTDDVLRVAVENVRPSPLCNAVSIAFPDSDDAHYLGFGQRFNKVDQRGEDIYFFVEEGGVGYEWARTRIPLLYPVLRRMFGPRGSFPNGEQCTGFPVPFGLVSRENGPTIGLFWNTYQPSWIKIAGPKLQTAGGDGPAVTRLTVLDDKLDLYLCAGPTPLEAMRQYTALTGRSDVPPPWVFLPWKTRTGAVTQEDTLEDIRRFRELDIPLAQVGIEHWQDIRGSYEFSKKWWPHIDDLIATARTNGYRVHIWHFPYMNAGSATHREGVRRGYFIRNRLGLPYQQRVFHGVASVVDHSNPCAAAWHGDIVAKAFHVRGIQGVMTDYAESIPPDSVFYNGQSGLAMRNAYPVMYCQAMQRAAASVLGDDYVLYPRAGYTGTQRFVAVQWPGDQDTDWDDGDGLPAAVRAMLNVSMCGFPVHGSDVGGWYDWYTSFTTKELYLRWAEVGCYSPLMRAHGGPMGRNREPWKFDEETIEIYRALSQEHVKLFPYLYSLAIQANQTGTPVIMHPSLLWPEQPELYQVEDAWMMGEALYVAPVVRQGQTAREVILPPGEWWALNEARPVRGPARIVAEAPFGQAPRFLRRGYILPRFVSAFDTFDDVSTARVGHLGDDLEVWLYPVKAQSSFTLFDGTVLTRDVESSGPRRVSWRIFG
jgi:alpha-glucosidase (family GH31 glycosyl hydrolase)